MEEFSESFPSLSQDSKEMVPVTGVDESDSYEKYLTEMQTIYDIPKSVFLKESKCGEAFQVNGTKENEEDAGLERYFRLKCYPNGDCEKNEGFVSLIFEENQEELFYQLLTLNVTFALVDSEQNQSFLRSFTYDHKEREIPINDIIPVLSFGLSKYVKRDTLISSDIFNAEKLYLQCDIQCYTLENDLEEEIAPFYLEDTVDEDGSHTSIVIETDHPVWAIICEKSPYFKKLIIQDGVTEISSYDEDECRSFEAMVRCVMSGTDPDRQDLSFKAVCNLFEFADYVLMSEFKQKCNEMLKEQMSTRNACNIINVADMHSDVDLKKFAIQFILHNWRKVTASKSWRVLCKRRPDLAKEINEYKEKPVLVQETDEVKESVVEPPRKRTRISETDSEYVEQFLFYQ